jgi:hypothetical protein
MNEAILDGGCGGAEIDMWKVENVFWKERI